MPQPDCVSSSSILTSLSRSLESRKSRFLLRTLPPNPPPRHDFSSNDYLGISRHPGFHELATFYTQKYHALNNSGGPRTSSAGSRLLSGNMPCLSDLEATASRFHKAEDALVFGNGYMACLGLIGCIAVNREDVFVVDELVHASCWDGRKLSRAGQWLTFQHGNVDHMAEVIQKQLSAGLDATKNIFVVIESVYSMGGIGGKVRETLEMCDQIARESPSLDVMVIVDEAHACGVCGQKGEGKVVELGLEQHPRLLARVITFGKGFGCYGAVVVGPRLLKEYLLNYARTVIYSTAVPVAVAAAMRAVYDFMETEEMVLLRQHLMNNIKLMKKLAGNLLMRSHNAPVQVVTVSGDQQCIKVGSFLSRKGFAVSAIRWPTVPKGKERIRIIVHAFNSPKEIVALVKELKKALKIANTRLSCRL